MGHANSCVWVQMIGCDGQNGVGGGQPCSGVCGQNGVGGGGGQPCSGVGGGHCGTTVQAMPRLGCVSQTIGDDGQFDRA